LPFSRDLKKEVERSGVGVNDFFIRVKSYSGTSSGEISFEGNEDNLEGKDLLIIEDIIDTGKTVEFLIDYLLDKKGAKSVKVISLLSKPSKIICDVNIDYLGMEIPDEFVIGYGLDFNEKYRELDLIRRLKNN